MIWDTDHNKNGFLQYGFLYASSNYDYDQIIWDTDHKENVSLQNEFFCGFLNFYQ